MNKQTDSVRIGGASGFWGDTSLATSQLLNGNDLDFIVYDYLAEITMAILGRLRAKDPEQGYATDFITGAMAPNFAEIERQKIRIVSNAGGVNPLACAAALRAEIEKQELNLKIAVVTGDDLMGQIDHLTDAAPTDMFTDAEFPARDKVGSANAYLGAFPIAAALDTGADIVITGRCVDSAVTLGACIHKFGWKADDLDELAGGSLAGHILECGTQATGGNFTDWELIGDGFADMGYPIAEVTSDAGFTVTKATDTDGLVSAGTVAEQMLYEIGNPQTYLLPDVTCDFSEVEIAETGSNEVRVSGTKGRRGPDTYKTCLTWHDGFRGGHLFGFYGIDAEKKAQVFADAAFKRSRAALRSMNAADFTETSVELIGAEAQFGEMRNAAPSRELNAKIAVKHPDAKGVGVFLKEATGLGLSLPPGLSGFAGARPKPTPVMKLLSYLTPKEQVEITIHAPDGSSVVFEPNDEPFKGEIRALHHYEPPKPVSDGPMLSVPLVKLALGRSGDKGDNANVGIIARKPEYLPWIWHALDDAHLQKVFGHFLEGKIDRFLLPGTSSMNILLHNILGGGGTSSLRNDPQGKGYAQLLLASEIEVPAALVGEIS